jgi:glycosyltransferase involved in cell wall biosynthesis
MAPQVNAAPPLHIVVSALTFRRPEGVAKLLDTLTRQVMRPERPYDLTVLIVDNDAAASGKETVGRFSDTGAYRLIYVVEPRQGIPVARNRAMDSAPPETDLFCFLDDDEWPVDDWLDHMLRVREQTGADCVYGPVEPVYPDNRPDYFVKSRVFERKRNADASRIDYAASNNVMFDLRLFRRLNLRFEERMRFTGGTDYLIFNKAYRLGVKIFWANDAVVYDIIPANRMTWKWLLQRQYRLGNTFALGDALEGSLGERVYRFGYGALRVGLGICLLPTFPFSPRWGMRSLTHILRGAGMVSGILGHAYQEYAPDRLDAEPGK